MPKSSCRTTWPRTRCVRWRWAVRTGCTWAARSPGRRSRRFSRWWNPAAELTCPSRTIYRPYCQVWPGATCPIWLTSLLPDGPPPETNLGWSDGYVAPRTTDWHRLKALVLDSVSSPITKRVYNLGLDEFFAWFALEPRPGFTKATVSAWRVARRPAGWAPFNVRITAVRKLAVEASDNGLLAR